MYSVPLVRRVEIRRAGFWVVAVIAFARSSRATIAGAGADWLESSAAVARRTAFGLAYISGLSLRRGEHRGQWSVVLGQPFPNASNGASACRKANRCSSHRLPPRDSAMSPSLEWSYRLRAAREDRRERLHCRRACPNGRRGRAVPVPHIHGVEDLRALYAGGLGPPFPLTGGSVFHPSVEATLARFAGTDAPARRPRKGIGNPAGRAPAESYARAVVRGSKSRSGS